MEEVYALCDRFTVFRDGKRVTTFAGVRELDRGHLVQAMVGRSIQDIYAYRPRPIGAVKLEAKGICGAGLPMPVDFKAHAGEIVGFFGLVGAGRSELMRLIYGAEYPTGGEIRLNGGGLPLKMPGAAVPGGNAVCSGGC